MIEEKDLFEVRKDEQFDYILSVFLKAFDESYDSTGFILIIIVIKKTKKSINVNWIKLIFYKVKNQ